MSNKDLIKHINQIEGIDLTSDLDISNKTTLGLKCIAKNFIQARTVDGLTNLISLFIQKKQNYLVIGKGSNLILPEKISNPVIQLCFNLPVEELSEEKHVYNLPASTPLNLMTGKAIKYGLRGWEVFTGVPATLGGAIWMNAGTSLGEIGELIKSLKVLRRNGVIEQHIVSEKDFSYRKNHFLNNGDIIISAEVTHRGIDKEVAKEIISYLRKRSKTQPLTKRTCGCTFKNVAIMDDGTTKPCIAGKVIDIMGLKGLHHRNLMVSDVHGNFIENHGVSTQADFLRFVETINSRIEKEYGHQLEMEAIVYRDSISRQ